MTKIEPNPEIRFLYKKCQKIRPLAIGLMGLVPEYVVALKNYRAEINDESVYIILKATLVEMLKNDVKCSGAKKIMRMVSIDVTGDENAWKEDIPEELINRPAFINELKYSVQSKYLYKVCNDEFLAGVFRENSVRDDIQAYEVLKGVFFPMVQEGYKTSEDPEKRAKFFFVRSIVERFAMALRGDRKAWKEDLNSEIRAVKKAARDGTFEERELSQTQLEAELLSDLRLPDADEDL